MNITNIFLKSEYFKIRIRDVRDNNFTYFYKKRWLIHLIKKLFIIIFYSINLVWVILTVLKIFDYKSISYFVLSWWPSHFENYFNWRSISIVHELFISFVCCQVNIIFFVLQKRNPHAQLVFSRVSIFLTSSRYNLSTVLFYTERSLFIIRVGRFY